MTDSRRQALSATSLKGRSTGEDEPLAGGTQSVRLASCMHRDDATIISRDVILVRAAPRIKSQTVIHSGLGERKIEILCAFPTFWLMSARSLLYFLLSAKRRMLRETRQNDFCAGISLPWLWNTPALALRAQSQISQFAHISRQASTFLEA